MIGYGEFALRLGCALGLGALIGIERQWRQRMAGLRTNALVATGSALFVLMVPFIGKDSSPSRVAAQVVSGIGFLGAGVILRDGIHVRGINTAATIWCAAAVGVLAGAGVYAGALLGAVSVMSINLFLRPVARRIDRQPVSDDSEIQTFYTLRVVSRVEEEAHIRALLLQALSGTNFILQALESSDLAESGKVEVEAELVTYGRDDLALERAVSRLSLEPSVTSVRWRVAEPLVTDPLSGPEDQ